MRWWSLPPLCRGLGFNQIFSPTIHPTLVRGQVAQPLQSRRFGDDLNLADFVAFWSPGLLLSLCLGSPSNFCRRPMHKKMRSLKSPGKRRNVDHQSMLMKMKIIRKERKTRKKRKKGSDILSYFLELWSRSAVFIKTARWPGLVAACGFLLQTRTVIQMMDRSLIYFCFT